MLSLLSTLIVKYRWLMFPLSLLATALLAPGAGNTITESDYRIFFDNDDPNLVAHEYIEQTYTNSDNVTILVSTRDGQTLFQQSHLATLISLTEDAWKLPSSIRVDSITNYQYTVGLEDDLVVQDLVEEEILADPTILAQRARAAADSPELINRLINPSTNATAVVISLQLPDDRQKSDLAAFEAVDAAKALARTYAEKAPALAFRIAGQTAVVAAFNDMTQQDLKTLFPIMLGIAFLIVFLMLRSVVATFSTILVLVLSVVSMMGIAGYTGINLNQVNAITPIIVLTLAVCNCVHLYHSYFKHRSVQQNKKEALVATVKENLLAISLTTLTTVVGFLSLNFSSSPPFRSLGNLSAIGVAFTWLYALSVVPALSSFSKGRRANQQNTAVRRITAFAQRLVIRYPNKIITIGGTLTVILAGCAFLNNLEDNTVGYFKPSVPIREASDFMQENLTGFDIISYSIESGESNGVNNPDFLKQVESFISWYEKQPGVTAVSSYLDVAKRLNKNMHSDNQAYYRIPEEQSLAAQYMLLYELSLPFGLDLNNLIDLDKSSLKVSIIVRKQKATQLISLEESAQRWFDENAPSLKTPGAGTSLLFAHIGLNNIKGMIQGSALALILITLTLMISLRSVKLGLLSALPNAIPAIAAIGLWGLFVGEVNVGVSVILSITLGLVVDDTVHFMQRFSHQTKELCKPAKEAILNVMNQVGGALITTTAALAIGFGALGFSEFNVNADMGVMVAITVVIALLFDMLVLPSLLTRLIRPKSQVEN